MEQITKALSDASGRRTEVAELTEEVREKEAHTLSRQEEIKQELASTQPILDQAKKAVGGIKSEHLNEITSLKMPPEAIADVLGGWVCVCVCECVHECVRVHTCIRSVRVVFWGRLLGTGCSHECARVRARFS